MPGPREHQGIGCPPFRCRLETFGLIALVTADSTYGIAKTAQQTLAAADKSALERRRHGKTFDDKTAVTQLRPKS